MTTIPPESRVCIRCHVAGHVQGVFFRASTRELAQRLGLSGYARNLPDGRVEVMACGDSDACAKLREWLRSGPPQADVSAVGCESLPFQDHGPFSTD